MKTHDKSRKIDMISHVFKYLSCFHMRISCFSENSYYLQKNRIFFTIFPMDHAKNHELKAERIEKKSCKFTRDSFRAFDIEHFMKFYKQAQTFSALFHELRRPVIKAIDLSHAFVSPFIKLETVETSLTYCLMFTKLLLLKCNAVKQIMLIWQKHLDVFAAFIWNHKHNILRFLASPCCFFPSFYRGLGGHCLCLNSSPVSD